MTANLIDTRNDQRLTTILRLLAGGLGKCAAGLETLGMDDTVAGTAIPATRIDLAHQARQAAMDVERLVKPTREEQSRAAGDVDEE